MIFWFKVVIGYTILILILDVIRWMSKNKWEKAVSKRVEVILSAPREKWDKHLKNDYFLIKLFKLMLWFNPLCLIMMVLLYYFSYSEDIVIYLIILIILGYPTLIHDYLLRKAIVAELESKT
jgi:hypothetical protein